MTLDEKLYEFLKICLGVIEATYGNLLLRSGENHLEVRATTSKLDRTLGTRVDIQSSITGRVVQTAKPQIVPDVKEDSDYKRVLQDDEMRSELAVPLFDSQQRVIGVLNIESPIVDAYNDRSVRLLETLAGQASILIQRSNEETVWSLFAQMSALIAREDFSSVDVYTHILEVGLSLINAHHGQLLLVHPETLTVEATTGKEKLGRLIEMESFCGTLVKSGSSYRISPDVSQDKSYKAILSDETSGATMRSELAVSVYSEDHIIAVLNFESPLPDAFNEFDAETLQTLARNIPITIQRAADRQFEQDLSEMTAELATAAADTTVDEWLDSMIEKTVFLLKAEHGQFMSVQGPKLKVESRTPRGDDQSLRRKGTTFDIDDSVTGAAVTEKKTIIIDDIRNSSKYCKLYKGTLWGSELVVPVMRDDVVIGVFNIESKRLSAFSLRHGSMVAEIAGVAALGLHLTSTINLQGKVFHATKTKLSLMRNMFAEAVEKFERSNTKLPKSMHTEFLGDVEAVQNYADELIKVTERLILPVNLHPLPIKRFITRYGDYLRNYLTRVNSSIVVNVNDNKVTDTAVIAADEEQLKTTIQLLVDNSIRALNAQKSNQKRITFVVKETAEHVRIEIQDTGVGMEEKDAKVFEEGIAQSITSGSGIGVPDAIRMLQQMHGALRLAWYKPGKGVHIELTLRKVPLVCVFSNHDLLNEHDNLNVRAQVYLPIGSSYISDLYSDSSSVSWLVGLHQLHVPLSEGFIANLNRDPYVFILDFENNAHSSIALLDELKKYRRRNVNDDRKDRAKSDRVYVFWRNPKNEADLTKIISQVKSGRSSGWI